MLKHYWPHLTLVIFYAVGIVGISLPTTRGLILPLTPGNLLLTLGLLMVGFNWADKDNPKTLLGIAIAALAGFLVEAIGVNTGYIFGTYSYGPVLGPQLWATPLLIGVNWAILVTSSLALTGRYISNPLIQAFVVALLMTGLDYFIEPVAILLDFWRWPGNQVPFQNYIGWFVTSFLISLLLKRIQPNWQNRLANTVLGAQLLFFCLLQILLIQMA